MSKELRETPGVGEVRVAADHPTSLHGYAAVFNEEAVIAGMFREVILPGAFDAAIKNGDEVIAQWNHGDGGTLPLGNTAAGTLRLQEDARGLFYEIDIPDTTQARDLAVSVKRGDVRKSSFMFEVDGPTGDTWDYSATKSGGLPLRQITRVKLYDVSPVGRPAYAGTSVSARAMELAQTPPREADAAPVEVPPVVDHSTAHLSALLDLDEVP